ncbi:MAG: flagellar protein FlgN [Clostridiales bacterium]|jgi:flagellar biosynthesis/type III secretory pathway chaperone|nr:flagellar protein FlgN [Clostridiales bacterium]
MMEWKMASLAREASDSSSDDVCEWEWFLLDGANDGIYGLMAEQAGCYEELLEIARAKRSVIIMGDMESLKKMTIREIEIVGRYKRTEKERAKLLESLAIQLGRNACELDMDMIIENSDESSKAALISLKKRMRLAVLKLREANELNKNLIENSLEYIDFSLNAMRGVRWDDGLGLAQCAPASLFDARQ